MYEGKLVRLRAFDNDDFNLALRYNNDYEIMRGVRAGLIYPVTTEDEARDIGNQTSYTSGEYQFAIETKAERRFIGQCGFIRLQWKNRVGEIAIIIGDKSAQGKGYGADAIMTLCRFGFDELNLHKIKVSFIDFNEAAKHCYEKCGFKKEGVLRQEVFREGAYHDILEYGMLEGEAPWNIQK